jgi:enoyl-CoA hydratase/carnithine racemase
MRYATPDCQISIMETKWGFLPDMSASVTLRELVRLDVAKELTMTGRTVLGPEAATLGLITQCVEDPWAHAQLMAQHVATRSPDAVAAAKHLYQSTFVAASQQECLELETKLQQQLLLGSWNQVAASARNFGVPLPYRQVQPNVMSIKVETEKEERK